MKKKILSALEKIEKDNAVKIIYAIESGSRMWGFASEDSDYDIRFIYISRPDFYLSVSKRRDCIDFIDKENDLDFSGWDLKKALGLLYKSNMSLYEWLSSPIVYRTSPEIERFRKLSHSFWDLKALIYSYIHLSRHNYEVYIRNRNSVRLKKYLYILRTILACAFMEKRNCPPCITIPELLPFAEDSYARDFLLKIIEVKKQGELKTDRPDLRINSWIEHNIEHYMALAEALPEKHADISVLDKFFCSSVLDYYNELAEAEL